LKPNPANSVTGASQVTMELLEKPDYLAKTEHRVQRAKKGPKDMAASAEEKEKADLLVFLESKACKVCGETKLKGLLDSKDKLAILEKKEPLELMEYLVSPVKFSIFRQSRLMDIKACAVMQVLLDCQDAAAFMALQAFLETLVSLGNAARLEKLA